MKRRTYKYLPCAYVIGNIHSAQFLYTLHVNEKAEAESVRREIAEAEGVPIKDISLTLLYRKVKR